VLYRLVSGGGGIGTVSETNELIWFSRAWLDQLGPPLFSELIMYCVSPHPAGGVLNVGPAHFSTILFEPVLRIHEILDSDPDADPDPRIYLRLMDLDPVIFVSDLQGASTKLIFFQSFFAYYFLKVHLHNFSKMKNHKEVTKQ
jgi:hypothetical protein